jgi:molecular chaperone DnaK
MPDEPQKPDLPNEESEESSEDGADRRKYPRAPLQLLIQYRFDTLDDFLTEYAVDVSIGGMFIRTKQPKEEGSMVYLQFALRDGVKIFEGLGKVVRVNPPDESGRIPGMGIEFVHLDEESKEIIDDIVARNLEAAAKKK